MILELRRIHFVLGVVGGVLVEIWEEDRLGVRGLDVLARTAVTVATSSDFVIE